MASNRREQLINTAIRLFSKQGYHATGIDQIISEAGVSKMTLYKYFRSKDELILTALRRYDEQARHHMIRGIEQRAHNPRERLLALFDVLEDWFKSKEYYGCMFINATAEFSHQDDPIHLAAAEHKRLFRGYLKEQAIAAGVENPEALVNQFGLLMDGAIVTAQINSQADAGASARSAASLLLTQALG